MAIVWGTQQVTVSCGMILAAQITHMRTSLLGFFVKIHLLQQLRVRIFETHVTNNYFIISSAPSGQQSGHGAFICRG